MALGYPQGMARLCILSLSLLVACGGDGNAGSGGTSGAPGSGGSAGSSGSGGSAGTPGSGGAGGEGGGTMQPDGSFSVKWGPSEVPPSVEGTQ